MRLDRFIENNTPHTRADVRQLIQAGRLRVNTRQAAHGAELIDPTDTVLLDGNTVQARDFTYLLLNKPAGYICAHSSEHYPSLINLLTAENYFEVCCKDGCNDGCKDPCEGKRGLANIAIPQLQIVGRLDVNTTGLILLTNDGEWNYRATAPEYGCQKTYRVQLKFAFNPQVSERFAEGILLPGESKPTLPAKISAVKDKQVRLQIAEGRYHQVKRMFAATKNKVVGLHREAIGAIVLPPDLAPGQYRRLSQAEVHSI